MGEAFAAKFCARRMQHRSHSAFRAGTQSNGGIRVVPKPASAQSIPPFLLDLDGTLVDSVYEHVMAWREALEDAEIRLPNWKIHRRIGTPSARARRSILAICSRTSKNSAFKQNDRNVRCTKSSFRKEEVTMATQKQRKAARTNSKKAAQAAKRKRTIAHLPKSVRTALGKQAAKVARQKRSS